MKKGLIAVFATWCVILAIVATGRSATIAAQSPRTAQTVPSSHAPLLNQYCVGCHNERARTGGLVLDLSLIHI